MIFRYCLLYVRVCGWRPDVFLQILQVWTFLSARISQQNRCGVFLFSFVMAVLVQFLSTRRLVACRHPLPKTLTWWACSLQLARMDAEIHPIAAQNFKVVKYPTLVFFKGGVAVDNYLGPRTINSFMKFIDEYLHKKWWISVSSSQWNFCQQDQRSPTPVLSF